MEKAFVRRYPYVASHVRAHGDLEGSGGCAECTTGGEGATSVRGDVERRPRCRIEDGVITLVGSNYGTRRKAGYSREIGLVGGHHDTATSGGP